MFYVHGIWRSNLVLCLCGAIPVTGGAEGDPMPGTVVPLKNREYVQQAYATNSIRYKGMGDVLVRPGLVADRKRQCVEILAESTGLSGNSIVEFLLISESSRHGYESLCVSFAKPSDIHKALEFIGLPAGAPYNPPKLRMWPKGERVLLSLISPGPGSTSTPIRIEKFILDKRTGKPAPETGFVFTGSIMVAGKNGRAGQEYGADVCEPKAVVSIYNEPYSVLDVPRLAHQSDVYGDQVVNPEFALAKGTLLTLFLEPEYKGGRTRVKDLILEAVPAVTAAKTVSGQKPAGSDPEPEAVGFKLQDLAGKVLAKEPSLPAVRQTLESLVGQGCDPFVSVRFSRELRLNAVQQACRLVAALDNESVMRVEPPGAGQLYYRAFLADEQWRKREGRPGQPWELILTQQGDKLAGKLIRIETLGVVEMPDSEFKITEFDIPDSAALRNKLEADAASRKLEKKRQRLQVILVFADPALTYGRLAEFIDPVLSANYVVYVFLQEAE